MVRSQPQSTVLAVFLFLLSPALVKSEFDASARFTNIWEAIPQLKALQETSLKRPVAAGGQVFSRCCLQAVSETYRIENGQVRGPFTDFTNLSPQEFNNSQFPCGAEYDDEEHYTGAPQITVPYSWCKKNCNGWERSKNENLGQWVQPFVGFILPSTVFCLNVPRRSVLNIFDNLFHNHFEDLPKRWREFTTALAALLSTIRSYFRIKPKKGSSRHNSTSQPAEGTKEAVDGEPGAELPPEFGDRTVRTFTYMISYIIIASFFMVVRATIATAISLINTIFWVAVVFSTAGPMILSGLYESQLDRKILHNMLYNLRSEYWHNKKISRKLFYKRVHQLYAVLVGNLEFGDPIDDNDDLDELDEKHLHETPKHLNVDKPSSKDAKNDEKTARNVWDDIKTLVLSAELVKCEKEITMILAESREPSPSLLEKRARLREDYNRTTESRLKAMLDCQTSFGAVVGAAVVFFVGSFLFSVIQNLTTIGDNDTSHALAFGMWWMIVPHVAIVSGCLLAGNNPNTLEVIMCSIREPWPKQEEKTSWWKSWWQRFYKSVYVPVPMAERGRNKRRWIRKLKKKYPMPKKISNDEVEIEVEVDPHLNFGDWILLSLIIVILIGLPFVLAFLTSYFTPAVGLSCRTFTFLLYFLFQVCYMAMWTWEFYDKKLSTPWRPFQEKKVHNKTDPEKGKEHVPKKSLKTKIFSTIHGLLLGFIILGSAFTSVFGTFFQLVGLYRNCLCSMPIKYWSSGNFSFALSSNTEDDIKYAKQLWLPTGVTSIVLMIVTCYIGWWYQRHWRLQFRNVVELLLNPPERKPDKPKAPKRPKGLKDTKEGSWVFVPQGKTISKISLVQDKQIENVSQPSEGKELEKGTAKGHPITAVSSEVTPPEGEPVSVKPEQGESSPDDITSIS